MEDVDSTGRRISYCFERDGASASGKVSVWEDGTIRSSLARWPNWYSVRFDKDGLSDVLMTDENEGQVMCGAGPVGKSYSCHNGRNLRRRISPICQH
jgi:hypothetical protein